MQDNIANFVGVLYKQNIITLKISFNVVIDEYPYLKTFTKVETIDSIFQSIIDNNFTNIRLFISGSHISMMNDMFEEKNALYGRFNVLMNLKELDYVYASHFYRSKFLYDKIGFYSIFGCLPYINSAIDESETLKENIINTILNSTSYIYGYTEHLLISNYTNANNAERIFCAISNGNKKYSEIENKLGLNTNGTLSKQLKNLEDMKIISKVYPINKLDDKKKVY